ncbi:hypothetical protein [Paracidovorax oryzae]|uniref:hypothetical protein n=1 Tax=Paracidovorax oryzae TaxID=862720 RepID=UPI0012FF0FB9|nr:hypothetical protein [Paracidovorax oryzae]
MPRINSNTASSSASQGTSSSYAGSSTTARQRTSSRHAAAEDGPPHLPESARRHQSVHEDRPGRARAALHALQRTAHAAAEEGGHLARAGVHAGMAAARGAVHHPILATGLVLSAGGAAYCVGNMMNNRPEAAALGANVAGAGISVLLIRTMLIYSGAIAHDAGQAIRGLARQAEQEAAASGRRSLISSELFIETMNHAMAIGDGPAEPGSLSALVGNRLPQLVDHLMDLRAGSAIGEVARTLEAAQGDPARLIHGLLRLIEANVLSSRPNSAGIRRDH